jgi:multiple sugar transport system substrate-binding protein
MPLGSPQLLLAYRADFLESAGIEPPTDWTAYRQAIRRLADRAKLGGLAPQADQAWQATAEPLADGWAGQLLLARAASYAVSRDTVSPLFQFDTMTPLIDQPPYVLALEELTDAANAGGFASQRLTPAEAVEQLLKGTCAMALGWPAPLAQESGAKREGKIAFALVPGSSQAYRFSTKDWMKRGEDENPHVPLLAISGRMAAVSTSSANRRRAQGFVIWLAGREISQQIAAHSLATTLFRRSQIASAGRWAGTLSTESSRQYAETLERSLTAPKAFPGLRLPGRSDYLASLDVAVRRALEGTPAAEVLAEAAASWRQITQTLGLEQQRRANSRSLGQGEF